MRAIQSWPAECAKAVAGNVPYASPDRTVGAGFCRGAESITSRIPGKPSPLRATMLRHRRGAVAVRLYFIFFVVALRRLGAAGTANPVTSAVRASRQIRSSSPFVIVPRSSTAASPSQSA